LKQEKDEFRRETVRYSGSIISMKGISMYEDRMATVQNWRREKKTKNCRLNNLFEVQRFLRFCNYYRRFIPKYSEKAEPLTRLTKKAEPLVWESKQQLAFETIATAFSMAPALHHFDH